MVVVRWTGGGGKSWSSRSYGTAFQLGMYLVPIYVFLNTILLERATRECLETCEAIRTVSRRSPGTQNLTNACFDDEQQNLPGRGAHLIHPLPVGDSAEN